MKENFSLQDLTDRLNRINFAETLVRLIKINGDGTYCKNEQGEDITKKVPANKVKELIDSKEWKIYPESSKKKLVDSWTGTPGR